MEQEIKRKQKEQANRLAEEKHKLRIKTKEEYWKLHEELQRLIKEAKQQKTLYKQKAYEQKPKMK